MASRHAPPVTIGVDNRTPATTLISSYRTTDFGLADVFYISPTATTRGMKAASWLLLPRGRPSWMTSLFPSAIPGSHTHWPGANEGTMFAVRICWKCQETVKVPPRQTNGLWPNNNQSWHGLHIEFAGSAEVTRYLMLVNVLLKWPEMTLASATMSAGTIMALGRLSF